MGSVTTYCSSSKGSEALQQHDYLRLLIVWTGNVIRETLTDEKKA